MSRLMAITIAVLFAGSAVAQCQRWYPSYPAYPITPAIWGAPAAKPLPPAPPPFVPKAGVGVREEEEERGPTPRTIEKPKEADAKEPPRIPKTKLPIPNDPAEIDLPGPKAKVPAKTEPKADAGKAVEQFIIPTDENRGEPRAQIKVGFFNHSDRQIVLDVNGEAVKLPSEQYVTLRLPRTFNWAEKGQKATDVVVPPDADGLEIVFRR
jgi:hypothetical protein